MLSKEEIEKAKEDLIFFNEGDYITRGMDRSADILGEYIKQLEQENNKQNKIIDEMAEHIANWDIEEDICTKVEKPLCNNETTVPVSYCIECVKQYFEKKVEE